MKLVKKTENYVFILLTLGLLMGSCQKDDVLEPDFNPIEQGDVNANKITQSLRFRSATVIKGTIPGTENARVAAADLKIDTDSIFWVEGIINRIKILKPENPSFFVGTFWAQVEGSDSYIDAEFEVELENDTLVFLNFEFDPEGHNLPLSFEITIVPKNDADGTPLDDFKLPVVIEEPIENLNTEDEDFWQGTWHWMETSVNGEHHTGPYENIHQDATAGLCCDGSGGVWNCPAGDPSYTEMVFTIDYQVIREFLHFSEISDVRGELREMSTNLDWANSNICDNEPAYTNRIVHNPFTGTFTKINSNTRTINNLVGESEAIYLENQYLGDVPLPIYAGSGPFVEYKLLSKHYMKEVRNNPEGGPGGGMERLYYKRFVDENLEFVETIWFDVCGVCTRN